MLVFKTTVTVPHIRHRSGQKSEHTSPLWQNTTDIWAERDEQAAASASEEEQDPHYRSLVSYRAQTKGEINNIGNLMDYGAQPGQRSGSELALDSLPLRKDQQWIWLVWTRVL